MTRDEQIRTVARIDHTGPAAARLAIDAIGEAPRSDDDREHYGWLICVLDEARRLKRARIV